MGYCINRTALHMNFVGVWLLKKVIEASPENDQNLFLNRGYLKKNIWMNYSAVQFSRKVVFNPVLRIRDILVRIRISKSEQQIRILPFSSVTFKTPIKKLFFAYNFLRYIYIIFQR